MKKASTFTAALIQPALVFFWIGAGGADAQKLPPGLNVDDPIPGYEVTTQQIGGAGWWRYMSIGALRCQSQTDGIVAVSTRKGTLIDYIQIGCAPIKRYRNGWGWDSTQVYWPAGKGNGKGGFRSRYAVCGTTSVISGFRAVYRDGNSYLQDLRFQCSQIKGIGPDPFDDFDRRYGRATKPGPLVIQIYDNRTTDLGWLSSTGRIKSYQQGYPSAGPASDSDDLNIAGKSQFIAESRCTGGAATALSVAVGRWFALFQPIGTDVIQAFQMFCREGAVDERIAEPAAPGR